MQAHPWALGLAVPGLILERRLISARFAALYQTTPRMRGCTRSRLGQHYQGDCGTRQCSDTILRCRYGGCFAVPKPP